MKFKHGLCWLRRDLRLQDNHALYEALRLSEKVSIIFVFDHEILKLLNDKDDRRVTFIYKSLEQLDARLREMGSQLIVRYGYPLDEILLVRKGAGIDALFYNDDCETKAKNRDKKVKRELKKEGVEVLSYKDQVIFQGNEVLKDDETPYTVFTPYKKRWLSLLEESHYRVFKPNCERLTPSSEISRLNQELNWKKLGFKENSLWLKPGIEGAKTRLQRFLKKIDAYKDKRDFPDEEATSGLSAHLRFGTISPRKLVGLALKRNTPGSQVWLNELIWREFYQMILDRFPYVTDHAFKEKHDAIKWPGKASHFKAWCEGQTGYPIIDAAMRHFNETGWMHNRLRMVVASFLVKDLLIDWKKGENYFARYLLDFDLASNNGGWQWSASTGCDAQPYFRIFNPELQSRKFDPKGNFIRQNVQELRFLSDHFIHAPSKAPNDELKGLCLGKNYPKPIVDHHEQKELALALFG